ncbi:uncharacterized protein LOC143276396 [Babylonia areolata]|uniref:uncharacterized protein LOC143276396 n=1 Tax=Babylonia areolata TaxID=304850 RepID=UPI003FD5F0B7
MHICVPCFLRSPWLRAYVRAYLKKAGGDAPGTERTAPPHAQPQGKGAGSCLIQGKGDDSCLIQGNQCQAWGRCEFDVLCSIVSKLQDSDTGHRLGWTKIWVTRRKARDPGREASTDNNNTSTGLNTSRFDCFLQLHVPVGSVTQLRTDNCSDVGVLAWRRNEGGQRVCPDHRKLSSCPELNPDTQGVTTTNMVTSPYRRQLRRPVLCFNFAFVNASADAPGFKVVFLTSSLGYIQTLRNIKQRYNSCAILTPPPGQVIFVSVNESSSCSVSLARFQSPCGHIKKPMRDLRLPFIFPVLKTFVARISWYLRALVVSDTEDGQIWNGTRPLTLLHVAPSFRERCSRLVFSFQQRRPVSTSYQWNCSKSEWPELYRHFPCDGQLQCLGGEDETQCFYHSDDCGAGKITVDGSCFIIIKQSSWVRATRREAEQKCETQGATLASFDSFRQWDSLVSTLEDMGHILCQGWIDMHSVWSTMKTSEDTYMKNMYINTWQWGGGGSVVYNFHASFRQMCNRAYLFHAANDPKEGSSISTTTPCSGDDDMALYPKSTICKMPTPSSDSQPSHDKIIIEAQIDMAVASPVPLATCPSGHVTHVALACDPDSQCLEKPESLDSVW